MTSISTLALLLAAACNAGRAREGPVQVDGEIRRRALLVGIEAYPEATGWPVLRGARADVAAMREVLVERAEFASDDIVVLLDDDATRAGIVAAFRKTADACRPGDVFLFYFAGHGSQLLDSQPDERDGLDETLVPFDALEADGRPNDLRDDELGELIQQANQRTQHVVLIFDCCNSGTNVRGEQVSRFVPLQARGLAGVRPARAPGGAEEGSGYAKPGPRYVALSACRSRENAYEYEVPPGERVHGLFTYCLVQELYRPAQTVTYIDLMDRVRRRLHGIRSDQTPAIEGPLDRTLLFGEGLPRYEPSYRVQRTEHGWRLEGGVVNGLSSGCVFDVRDSDAVERGEARSVGRLELDEVAATESTCRWIGEPPSATESILRGFLVARGVDSMRLGFAIEPGAHVDRAAARALSERLRATMNLREVAWGDEQITLRWVAGDTAGRWEVLDGPERLPLSANASSEAGLARLVSSLSRLGAAHRARHALRNDVSDVLRVETRFELVDSDGRAVGPLRRDSAGRPVLSEKESFGSTLVNHSAVPVYASLLVLSPDAEIQVWERPMTIEDSVPPGGQTKCRIMNVRIPDGASAFYTSNPQCFRWVVTTRYRDLSSLVQRPVTEHRTERSGPDDVRGLAEAAARLDEWVTAGIDVAIERD